MDYSSVFEEPNPQPCKNRHNCSKAEQELHIFPRYANPGGERTLWKYVWRAKVPLKDAYYCMENSDMSICDGQEQKNYISFIAITTVHMLFKHTNFGVLNRFTKILSLTGHMSHCHDILGSMFRLKCPVDVVSTGQVNEEVERKFQHLASSVHKMGMILDSVQNDVMQLNRAMKEASLDSGSIQKKFVLLEDSLKQIVRVVAGLVPFSFFFLLRQQSLINPNMLPQLKGQDDLRALLEGITESNPDQVSVLNSLSSKQDEMSLLLSVLPNHVQRELGQLKGDISRIFSKEMEVMVRAVRSVDTRLDQMQMLAACLSVSASAPAPLAYQRKTEGVKPNVEKGMVKAATEARKLDGSGDSRPAPPKEQELAIQKDNADAHAPINKAIVTIVIDSDEEAEEGSASCVMLKTGAGGAGEGEALEILRRARKRRRREEANAVALDHC
uniref:Uncharacterized protein n=1 Tax=Aegilops tauschii TaxID=37682 RepID=M8CRK7_AEGTA